jgi:predicted nucleic acid-binding protein
MIVVADTSPILYLVLIDQIGLLQSLYGNVIIPDAVAAELLAPASPTPVRSWISNPPGWIQVTSPTPEQLDAVAAELDLGERMAIALATAFSADLLLIDDARGRHEARRRHLVVTGTLGVLRTAAEQESHRCLEDARSVEDDELLCQRCLDHADIRALDSLIGRADASLN